MLKKKNNGLVYLDRTSFSYFTENNTVLTFTYPTSSIKELDVISEQIFVTEVTNFFKSNNILPSTIAVILSADILYEKDFIFEPQTLSNKKNESKEGIIDTEPQPAIPTAAERMAQMQSFLDLVPFDEIASKPYKIDKNTKLVATNKKLYEMMVNILNKQNFIVEAVVPITVIPKTVIDTPALNIENAKKIFKKFETLIPLSLLEENSYALSRAALSPHVITMSTKVSSKREFALIGVFGVLILILGIVSYFTFFSPAKERKIESVSKSVPPTVIIPPTNIPTPDPSATISAQLNKEFLRFQITGGTVSQVNLLRRDLINNGYRNITPRPNNIASSGRVTVVFSTVLSNDTKDSVLEQLRKSFLTVSAQEAILSDVDAIINL